MTNQPSPLVVPIKPEMLEEATGTDQPHLQQHLIDQVYRTLWIPEGLAEDEKSARIASAISLLQGIKPADEISHQAGDGFRQSVRDVVPHSRQRDELGICNLLRGVCARGAVDQGVVGTMDHERRNPNVLQPGDPAAIVHDRLHLPGNACRAVTPIMRPGGRRESLLCTLRVPGAAKRLPVRRVETDEACPVRSGLQQSRPGLGADGRQLWIAARGHHGEQRQHLLRILVGHQLRHHPP